ncbi:MAG TPA: GFA family protein [Rhizobiaceae bacterium]|nr:GFA family protein [Rhizobiaceae bacterium]
MPGDMHKGGCGCGAVRFELRGALRPVIFCHCDQCRRQSSHFLASSEVDDAMLTIISGADDITWYRSSDFARRGFCGICGSGLFWKQDGTITTSVMAGSFDLPTGLKAQSHIFVSQKGDYYAIEDGLPQHDRWDQPPM